MRENFTSGSVGRAPGNRCLYPELDTYAPRTPELQEVGDVRLLFDSEHQPTLSASVGEPISRHYWSCRMEDYLFELYVLTG
jgi:hypothetical protein